MSYLILVLGVACAAAGGELFLRAAVGLARWARISAGIIGVTVAAFATSSPELSVAVGSAVSGAPEISLGDALGSNIVNIALILGLVLSLGSMSFDRTDLKRDFPVALLAPLLLGMLAVDGLISRYDGVLLLAVFLLWIALVTRAAYTQRQATTGADRAQRQWLSVVLLISGLVLLITAGRLIVTGATALALQWGLDAFVVGAIIVAVGTSAPELATALVARLRKHDNIGLGTLLGSNIFNLLFIVAVAALIHPIKVNRGETLIALFVGMIAVGLVWPSRHGLLARWRGMALLLVYGLYLVLTLRFGQGH